MSRQSTHKVGTMHRKAVSIAAATAAAGLAGWMGIMACFPEHSGVRPQHVGKWLLVDTIEFTALMGFANTANLRPRHAAKWATGAAVIIAGDALLDLVTSRAGRERRQAALMAAIVEIPSVAGLSTWAVHHRRARY